MKADNIREFKHGGLMRHELAVRIVNDEVRYPPFRIFRDLAQHRTELCRQPRDRRGIEKIGGIVECRLHAAGAIDDIKRKVEMRTCEVHDVDLGGEPFDAIEPARRRHVVELGLEQRIVAAAAFGPQTVDKHFEGKILMRQRLDHRFLHLQEQAPGKLLHRRSRHAAPAC